MTDYYYQSLHYSCTQPEVWSPRGTFKYWTPTVLQYEFGRHYFGQTIGPVITIRTSKHVVRMELYASDLLLFYSDDQYLDMKYELPLYEIPDDKIYLYIHFEDRIPWDLTLYCNYNDYIKYHGLKEILLEYPDNTIRICDKKIMFAYENKTPIYAKKKKEISIISKLINWIKHRDYHAISDS